jgi:hypothetical protein
VSIDHIVVSPGHKAAYADQMFDSESVARQYAADKDLPHGAVVIVTRLENHVIAASRSFRVKRDELTVIPYGEVSHVG